MWCSSWDLQTGGHIRASQEKGRKERALGQRDTLCSDHLGWYILGTTKDLREEGRGWEDGPGPECEELRRLRGWDLILEAAGDAWSILSRKLGWSDKHFRRIILAAGQRVDWVWNTGGRGTRGIWENGIGTWTKGGATGAWPVGIIQPNVVIG